MKRLFFSIILILLMFFWIFVPPAKAEGASLYLSPAGGTFFVGSTFDISIFINTGGNNINAVNVELKFDPKKIQIASPTTGKSFIAVWVSQPNYSNINGTASFQGGVPSPGVNTSSGLVSTITFRVITPGETTISLLDSSQILLDDGKGTNILSSLSRGVYTFKIPPPEGPTVFSTTHPDQNKWYNNNSPTFSWEKEEGITDFSYTLDDSFFSNPDNISEGDYTSVSFSDLKDKIWYFHIKAKKAGVWGGISNHIIQVDTTPPAFFKLSFEPTLRLPLTTSRTPTVSFLTTDNLSGADHYELKIIDLGDSLEKSSPGFFIEASSPYKIPSLTDGEYEILVRAYDVAGNWRDSSQNIEVIPVNKIFYVTKNGVYIFNIFLSWQKVILFLIFLIALILIAVSTWRRTQKKLKKEREKLEQILTKTRKENEEIKEKLQKTNNPDDKPESSASV
ncbi:MAG: cohesin domain-containing protein [Candidatus Parcubacteria bacterium]|nr:cohesin domain-containing protein [Candidatus Parcubacteria bacterium]